MVIKKEKKKWNGSKKLRPDSSYPFLPHYTPSFKSYTTCVFFKTPNCLETSRDSH